MQYPGVLDTLHCALLAAHARTVESHGLGFAARRFCWRHGGQTWTLSSACSASPRMGVVEAWSSCFLQFRSPAFVTWLTVANGEIARTTDARPRSAASCAAVLCCCFRREVMAGRCDAGKNHQMVGTRRAQHVALPLPVARLFLSQVRTPRHAIRTPRCRKTRRCRQARCRSRYWSD